MHTLILKKNNYYIGKIPLMIKRKKPILVTGSHRSGSTWVGKILNLSNETYYINEPFNIETHNSPSNPFKYWFEYVEPNSN